MGAFEGWRGDFQGFFLGLQLNNTKAYFEAHRRQYEQEVKGPMLALLSELEAEFGPAKVSRPNRDIRFSANKAPYKTNIYADAREGGYVALDADGLVAAGGRYMMDAEQLAKFRESVATDGSGKQLTRIVDALRAKGYEISGIELKRVPSPHAQDHPRGELLRHKRLIYHQRWDVGPWIATADARDRVAEAWRDGARLNAWLSANLDS